MGRLTQIIHLDHNRPRRVRGTCRWVSIRVAGAALPMKERSWVPPVDSVWIVPAVAARPGAPQRPRFNRAGMALARAVSGGPRKSLSIHHLEPALSNPLDLGTRGV